MMMLLFLREWLPLSENLKIVRQYFRLSCFLRKVSITGSPLDFKLYTEIMFGKIDVNDNTGI